MRLPLLLKSHALAKQIHEDVKKRAQSVLLNSKIPPKLSVILVGEDPASAIYVRKKLALCQKLGIASAPYYFSGDIKPAVIFDQVQTLNEDPSVHGILIQRPLPSQFHPHLAFLNQLVDPTKDVDGFHPFNAGRLIQKQEGLFPCTPCGIVALLHFYQLSVSGKLCVMIGRSLTVGMPLASLLLQHDATVIQTHQKTQNLPKITKMADFIFVATGVPEFLKPFHLTPQQSVVVDVGIHRDCTGLLKGDVAFDEVAPLTQAITPVPGGVGPMTLAYLMINTLRAAEAKIFNKK